MPAVDDLAHRLTIERLDQQGRYPGGIWRGAVSHSNKPNATIASAHRVSQRLELLGLNFIGGNSELDTRVGGRTIDQLLQANVGGLSNVNHGSAPRRITTKFERKSSLPDSGKPLDVKVMDAAW
jgi:hypothetical protein